MAFLFRNLYKFIKESIIINIPEKYKKEFEDVLFHLNLPRIKFVNVFVIIISCILILIARNKFYLILYIILFFLMLLWHMLLYKPDFTQKRVNYIKISYEYVIPILLMFWGLIISYQDKDLVVFVIIACINSMIIIRNPVKTLIIYIITFSVFIVLAPYRFSYNYLIGYYINASILFIFSIITSRMLYLNQINEFVNKKIIQNKNEELGEVNNEIRKKSEHIQILFDNVEQGFLTFTEDLIVEEQYSHECLNIFGENIAHKYYPDLIFSGDKEQKQLLKKVLNKALEMDDVDADIYLSLLPDEFEVNNRLLKCEYKRIRSIVNNKYMVILKDITEKRTLENKMEEEQNTLKMVLQAVVYYNDFFECINDYKNFCKKRIFNIIREENKMETALIKIFKAFHTFKGNFYQLHMKNTAGEIQEFEDEINSFYEKLDKMTEQNLIDFFKRTDMTKWIDKEMGVLKEILGEDYFCKENIVMTDVLNLKSIENKILTVCSREQCKALLPEIRSLSYKSVKEMLEPYKKHVERLAAELNKSINPLQIYGGDDILINPEKYNGFIKTLVHIFRNAVGHGIEYAEERLLKGKDSNGNIDCEVLIIENQLVIVVEDDGCGIDFEVIKRKAIESGIYSEEEIVQISDDDIVQLIFREQISTCNEVDDLSGRGLGLSAVKNEVSKLSGNIEVITKKDIGTKFKFFLPYENIFYIDKIPDRPIKG